MKNVGRQKLWELITVENLKRRGAVSMGTFYFSGRKQWNRFSLSKPLKIYMLLSQNSLDFIFQINLLALIKYQRNKWIVRSLKKRMWKTHLPV